jgi:hypothetical protein
MNDSIINWNRCGRKWVWLISGYFLKRKTSNILPHMEDWTFMRFASSEDCMEKCGHSYVPLVTCSYKVFE